MPGMALPTASGGSSPRTWGTRAGRHRYHHGRRFIPTHVGNTSWGRRSCGWHAVHPHARGEHHACVVRAVARHGSSPRTWGTRGHGQASAGGSRFIPTHVGNTSVLSAAIFMQPVHPHARGEHNAVAAARVTARGSSPRTWGTQPRRAPHGRKRRFIPTHVGNTPLQCPMRPPLPVHPHARGEHEERERLRLEMGGSSPRTWGTRSVGADRLR